MTVTTVCVVWFFIGVNRMERAMFLSVSDHLVCNFLESILREGLDLNGTYQFLVQHYYVNLMSGTIFGRLTFSRLLWHIKAYEFLTFWRGIMVPSLQSCSVSTTAVRESQISHTFCSQSITPYQGGV